MLRMAREFNGDSARIRAASSREVARLFGMRFHGMGAVPQRVFADLALVLAMIPGAERWNKDEKEAVAAIVNAKISSNESEYLRRLQKHPRLRAAIIALGSAAPR